jgi:hypothetical protein
MRTAAYPANQNNAWANLSHYLAGQLLDQSPYQHETTTAQTPLDNASFRLIGSGDK